MPRQTRAEIEQSLLKGDRIPWVDGGKRQLLELDTPVRRRLFAFLLNSKVRVVKGLPADFILGLAEGLMRVLIRQQSRQQSVASPELLDRGV